MFSRGKLSLLVSNLLFLRHKKHMKPPPIHTGEGGFLNSNLEDCRCNNISHREDFINNLKLRSIVRYIFLYT
jgi:hypothetical protein